MRALSSYRQKFVDSCYIAADVWDDFRRELGRRVAKSKRREIAELQHQVTDLREQLNDTQAQALAAAAAVEILQEAIATKDAFDAIRRHEEPGW